MKKELENLNSIIRHIKRVEDNCNIIAKKLYSQNAEFSRSLIQLGRQHDLSKLVEPEFSNLNSKSSQFKYALKHHHEHNPHHPEYWSNGILGMSDLYIAEMVCDCFARSQEFGTDVRKWFFGDGEHDAPSKYGYKEGDKIWDRIKYYLELLLTPEFSIKHNA